MFLSSLGIQLQKEILDVRDIYFSFQCINSPLGLTELFSLNSNTKCALTACKADEGQDSTGITLFLVCAVLWARLGKLTQEVLGRLLRFHHRRRRWRRRGALASVALISLTAWKITSSMLDQLFVSTQRLRGGGVGTSWIKQLLLLTYQIFTTSN